MVQQIGVITMEQTTTPAYKYLADLYLDWLNNYLTLSLFADHNGISKEEATILIDMGRNFHEQIATQHNTRGKQ